MRSDLVRAARAYLGVPWKHLGRDPARGLDCVGLVLRAAQDVGLLLGVVTSRYPRRPDGHRLSRLLAEHAIPGPPVDLLPGDVISFVGWERLPCHLALVTVSAPHVQIIHSYADVGKVVEHLLTGFWQHPVARWRIKGLPDG